MEKQNTKENKPKLACLVATFFCLGRIKFAPGTIGSIVAIPLYLMILFFIVYINDGAIQITSFDTFQYSILIIAGLFLLGVWASSEYSNFLNKDDPKEIIIDEIVALLLAFALVTVALGNYGINQDISRVVIKYSIPSQYAVIALLTLTFVFFRLFDILKPWPINYIENKVKGGLGIMLDDIVAAILACLFLYGCVLALGVF
jgi:phosphatidylglycerophosphatase A